MTKFVNDAVLDVALDEIKQNCDKLVACDQYPTTFAEANATYALADVARVPGDFTISDGDTNGRKVRSAGVNGVTVDADGDADHVAWLDTGNSRILAVTECNLQQLVSGSTVDFPPFDYEIADPT